MYYIQRKAEILETVDEATTKSEAVRLLSEYQIADESAHYYVSKRACADWRTR